MELIKVDRLELAHLKQLEEAVKKWADLSNEALSARKQELRDGIHLCTKSAKLSLAAGKALDNLYRVYAGCARKIQ